jgi:hypothetical protein
MNRLEILINHQKQIKGWIQSVHSKIYELETSYLDESKLGNIIKGFEIDGRTQIKSKYDDKGRLFSGSSYRATQSVEAETPVLVSDKQLTTNFANKAVKISKKKRKSTALTNEEWQSEEF